MRELRREDSPESFIDEACMRNIVKRMSSLRKQRAILELSLLILMVAFFHISRPSRFQRFHVGRSTNSNRYSFASSPLLDFVKPLLPAGCDRVRPSAR